jgi:RNA polymerase sigma-70 factor (ECF subfamily)
MRGVPLGQQAETSPSHEVERSICAARNGSPSALGRILDTFRAYLQLVAERELTPGLRGKLGASDLVQQTFLQAHRNFEAFRGTNEEELLRWLQRILLNEALMARRRFQDTTKRNLALEVPLDGPGSKANLADALALDTPPPDGRAQTNEELARLAAAIERLPTDYRSVVRLRYWERKSLVEIGRELGRSEDSVRKLWVRAIERLQRECAEVQPRS